MKRLPFRLFPTWALLAAPAIIAAITACGGISDPTKDSTNEPVATVSGALTGLSTPANTHVALVWKVGQDGGLAVGNDVLVVNGQFTMNLAAPPANYFFVAENTYDSLSGGGSTRAPQIVDEASSSSNGSGPAPSGGTSSSSSTSSTGGMPEGADKIHPKDTPVSGSITQPLNAAIAGFVVYVDTNNNGKLDLQGEYADSPDEILGGNKELLLTYLKDGGALDYEKLRDRSGILPQAGYNLAWDEGRWMPLNIVELKLSEKTKLPSAVCTYVSATEAKAGGGSDNGGTYPSSSSSSSSGSSGSSGSSTTYPSYPPYPPKNDPKLHCSNGGYSWSYDGGWGPPCPTPPPPPVGMCASDYGAPTIGCAMMSGASYDPDANPDIPSNWPCDITPNTKPPITDGGVPDASDGGTPTDAGPAPDAGK